MVSRSSLLAACLGACALVACGEEPVRSSAGSAWEDPGRVSQRRNRPPLIESVRLLPAEPAPTDVVRAVVRASDADGDRLDLGFEWQVGGVPRPDAGGELTLSGLAPGTLIEVKVSASDGEARSADSAQVRVRNSRPVITGVGLEPAEVVPRGEILRARASSRDPDDDEVELRFEWSVNGRWIGAAGDSLDTAELKRGDEVRVRAFASDGEHEGTPHESAVVRVGNGPPQILSQPGELSEQGIFRYQVEAVDPDAEGPMRYTLREGPPGMKLDGRSGLLTWRATADGAGHHEVVLVVQDVRGSRAVQEFALEVRVGDQPVPAAPAP